MNRSLLIVGAGGHGRVIADIAEQLDRYETIAFLDDVEPTRAMNYWGKTSEASQYAKECDFIVAIGNNATRSRLQEGLLMMGCVLATLVHPSASVSKQAILGDGCVVMPGCVINTGAVIGKGGIVNTAATVDHDCQLGDYCHLSPGAHLCGTVKMGDLVWIGAGATVINNISIVSHTMVGAGATVIKEITEPGTYAGVPARRLGARP